MNPYKVTKKVLTAIGWALAGLLAAVMLGVIVVGTVATYGWIGPFAFLGLVTAGFGLIVLIVRLSIEVEDKWAARSRAWDEKKRKEQS